MLMPKAAMNENDFFLAAKDDVGLTWQGVTMQRKAVAHASSDFSHSQFRLCIL
jgi:hypothetical protein